MEIKQMQKLSEIESYKNTVNNVNKNINNNDTNVSQIKNKYMLDKTKFVPSTEETLLAEEIASQLSDLQNYAAYLNVINTIGCENARRLRSIVLDDIRTKARTKNPVRKPGAYFMWVFKKGIY